MSASEEFDRLVMQAYGDGFARHGDLGLTLEAFTTGLVSVVNKHLGMRRPSPGAIRFTESLHTEDLYLAMACAEHSEAGWQRFGELYRKYVEETLWFDSPNRAAAGEVADTVLVSLFLPDRSGRSRIASYDGRSSLATWLRVVINHRATNERERKYNIVEQVDGTSEIPDETAVQQIEARLRANRYEHVIADTFRCACKDLQARERLMLLWRYEDGRQLGQIAGLLGVHQSTVTRQLERLHRTLRDKVVSLLASKYHFGPDAIEECLIAILESPSHSIVTMLKETSEFFRDQALSLASVREMHLFRPETRSRARAWRNGKPKRESNAYTKRCLAALGQGT